MPKVFNRARMTTTTTGTGTITLDAAVTGYQTFAAAGVQNSDSVHYTIEDGTAWEIGTGTYTSTGTTLSRTLVQSTTGSLLNLSGSAQVFITAPASAIADLDAVNASTARTNLGLVIGTNVQAYDGTLQSLSALGTAADRFAYTTGVDTWAEGTITTAGRAILDDVDAAAQRTTLGLGTMATQAASSVAITGGTATLNNTGLRLLDTNASHGLTIAPGSDLTADRTLTITTGDAARTLTLSANLTVNSATTISSAGAALIDDADAAAQRTTLGLGGLATLSTVGTTELTNDAVTYAKIQNVSATDRLLGRSSAGAGDIEEITCTSAGRALIDDADAAAQRTTLGLVIGTNVQAYDAELQAIAGLTSAADQLPYFTGSGTAALTTLTSAGRALIDDVDAAAQRTTLGLVIGTNVQAYDAELAAIAGLTSAADRLPYFTGAGTAALATFTAAGRALVDDADAAAQRTTLGLGSLATLSTVGTTELTNDAVTYAKIQNVSATDRILGRVTAGAGDIEEITCTAAGRALIDDVDAAAQRTTLGLGTLATQSGTFSGTSSGTNTGDQNIFQTIAVAGQSNVVADTTTDTLTLAAGSNITITTNATTDTITIAATTSITDGDKGDITVSASGAAWTIDNDAVTYAKIQNVSATDRLLGRVTAGAGDIEEITCTAAGRALIDDADAAAQRTTLGLGSIATLAAPSGTVVGTTDTQTLTNKTLTDPAIIGTILEDIFTITDGIAFEVDPANGSIQLITLGANRTPKATNFLAGESVTLMVDDGSAFTLTWSDTTWGTSGVTWVGGAAPTLSTTGYTVIEFWKVGTKVYGALVGTVA